ncbi:hypothetical protein M427DRAFT_29838 [Gonapodya prolifera JEL478]|uniref:Ribonuclease P/MRP protein subunit POP5 n=1 Tax=Gonapodya prolifera (strain JEL478) TaxID=1344416 RepID=A0A139ANL4_GONPJ|nr:hypothetical protein M427DRAFT_29838 [Gonapodya prolifera JEL478]|eukprot:KXS18085.1 hypothetical protein M427DRAFT_29838 [Gonapodya prolifera JEL478]
MVRVKNRWILFNLQFHADDDVSTSTASIPMILDGIHAGTVSGVLRDTVEYLFGAVAGGVALGGVNVKYYNPLTGLGILRCLRDNHRLVWAALTFVSRIRQHPCKIVVIRVCGTVKKCQMAALRWDRQGLLEARARLALTDAETATRIESSRKEIAAIEG